MTFLYVVHVYMFCNVVLYCIALPARVLFAIKIIIIIKMGREPRYSDEHTNLYTIYDNIPIIMKDPSFVFGNPLLSSCIFCCEN